MHFQVTMDLIQFLDKLYNAVLMKLKIPIVFQ